MSLPDTIFIFGLALVIFGPKKLPEIGRQLGKLLVEFRRASNEFKMQIEDELRAADELERQRAIAQPVTVTQLASSESPAALAEPSEPLTIRPPSSGAIVSADGPIRAASIEPQEVEPPEIEQPELPFIAAEPEASALALEEESPGLEALEAEQMASSIAMNGAANRRLADPKPEAVHRD